MTGAMALLRRTRRKGIVLLAIICITSSTLVRIFIQGEQMYKRYSNHHTDRSLIISHTASDLLWNTSLHRTLPTPGDPSQCTDEHCSNRLSSVDKVIHKQCSLSAARLGPLERGSCQFVNGSKRGPIALASFPGSGNTWVRGLLQMATGICTGSIYCDRDLRRHGFVGEGLFSGSVLVTKTHKANSRNIRRNQLNHPNLFFSRAIFIVRNPYHALVSERNRQIRERSIANASLPRSNHSNHLTTGGKEYFGFNREWDRFVGAKVKWWKNMIHFWLVEWSGPVLVVSYEELKRDPVYHVRRLLDFIEYRQLNEKELIWKLSNGYSAYRRRHHGNFTHYTVNQIKTINHYIQQIDTELKQLNSSSKRYDISLTSYLEQIN